MTRPCPPNRKGGTAGGQGSCATRSGATQRIRSRAPSRLMVRFGVRGAPPGPAASGHLDRGAAHSLSTRGVDREVRFRRAKHSRRKIFAVELSRVW